MKKDLEDSAAHGLISGESELISQGEEEARVSMEARTGIEESIQSYGKASRLALEKVAIGLDSQASKAKGVAGNFHASVANLWKNFIRFLIRRRVPIGLIGISMILLVTGNGWVLLFVLVHAGMIFFAIIHTVLAILGLVFDNLFGVGIFNSIGSALYNITYSFYISAFKITNSVVVWLQWIHLIA